MKNVDIIIPVYNAYEDLIICVESLKKYTDLKKHRAIFINDCSPDERIAPYLDSLKQEGLTVIHNKQNRGFSENVNLGFRQSQDRDVVLLNTDTILTERWLEKLIACAYSDAAIATVTPLSNNAELCSVPEFCKENKLPQGFTLPEFAALVERCSLKRYPRITVAVGFCMYIKREVIVQIGDFDAKTFERGYGEENDFCFRAEQVGYYHAMCDTAYVYHSGTRSFVSKEKQTYIDAHGEILNQRYPLQMQKNHEHVQMNPNAFVQNNVKLYIPFHNGKKNLLFLAQSDFLKEASDHVGGVQLHLKDLTKRLKKEFNIFMVARDGNYIRCTGYTEKQAVKLKFYIGEQTPYPVFQNKKLREIYDNILKAFCIDLVHVHHVMGVSLEMYEAAKELGLPVVTTMHDYYMVCPSEKLLDCRGNVCGQTEVAEVCAECLSRKLHIRENLEYLEIWRKKHLEVLKGSREIIVPSIDAKTVVSEYYPEIAGKIKVIEHGSDIIKATRNESKAKPGFRVAFIGGINESKGSRIIYRLVKNSDLAVDWYLFGGIGDRDLAYLNKKNFHKMGVYKREELPDLLHQNQIDLICIFSVWPETFCYTLSEAVSCEIPILVSGIGALKSRVEKLQCGWIIEEFTDTQKILAKIEELSKRPEEYRKCQERIQELKLMNTEEMAACYKELYEKNMKNMQKRVEAFDAEKMYQGFLLAAGKNAAEAEIPRELLERLYTAEKNLHMIYNSVSYKAVCKVRELPIPGKQVIKKVLYKLYKRKR